jgi:cytoskeletal protein CcmA (bactofilin family)
MGNTSSTPGADYANQYDFILGNFNQLERGDTKGSRALVKDNDARLVMNKDADFTGGVNIQGPRVNIDGDLFSGPITARSQIKLDGAIDLPTDLNRPTMYHRNNVGLGLHSDYAMTFDVNGASGTPTTAMRILNNNNIEAAGNVNAKTFTIDGKPFTGGGAFETSTGIMIPSDKQLNFNDQWHGVTYSADVNGPNVFGWAGGKLSAKEHAALTWNGNGVTVNNNIEAKGNVNAKTFTIDGQPFTGGGGNPNIQMGDNWGSTAHDESKSWIGNDKDGFKSLMLVGNSTNGKGRQVGVWDDLTVSRNLKVNGDINAKSFTIDGKPFTGGGGNALSYTYMPMTDYLGNGIDIKCEELEQMECQTQCTNDANCKGYNFNVNVVNGRATCCMKNNLVNRSKSDNYNFYVKSDSKPT